MASGFPFALLLCLSIGLLAPSCYGQTSDTGSGEATDPSSSSSDLRQGSCPPGWTHFGSRCFSFYFQRKTWVDAEKVCKAAGGNLASVHSAEEYDFLKTYIHQVTGENKVTWIGGFDSVQESEWMWSDGSTFDYTSWDPNQPDNEGGVEHCLEMNYHDNWNDYPCDKTRHFLCAKKL
ncbi:galactose-specific lectin nattectin isoform X2 [Perca flavescens]|uniref:C-type lectin 8 n=1 Tax=Perca flavescens TaxID=8167 RepID=C3UZY5_PERFV|nr:galactose-specific lectin nattectin-like isoform X2 [Perca flavescens]ACO82041.1 C-type lectin 8 [Perca flavescens]